MFPWSSDKRRYFPLLHTMGADLRGFSQLPKGDGAYLTPIIPLAPVPNAHKFDNTLATIRNGVNGIGKIFVADLSARLNLHIPLSEFKPVHHYFQKLSSDSDGFIGWRQFIRSNSDMLPVLQMGEIADMLIQAEDFADLGRGMVLRLRINSRHNTPKHASSIIQFLSRRNQLDHLLIVIDLEHVQEATAPAAMAAGLVRSFMSAAGNQRLNIAICATSFPRELRGEADEIVRYPITERLINQLVENALGRGAVNLLYSDYASARTRTDEEGGGRGYPRIDYATRERWSSNRQKNGDISEGGFIAAANNIMNDGDWNDGLEIYGANMIREAARGILEKRRNAKFWVSVRINLHLHRQAHFYSSDSEFLGQESDWDD